MGVAGVRNDRDAIGRALPQFNAVAAVGGQWRQGRERTLPAPRPSSQPLDGPRRPSGSGDEGKARM